MEWKTEMEQLLAQRRQQLGEPVSLEEILDLHDALEGEVEMAEDVRQDLLERISADPEAASKLRHLLRFPALPEDGEELDSGELTERDESDGLEQRWQTLRPHLKISPNAGAPPASPDSVTSIFDSPRGRKTIGYLAASLIVGVIALAIFDLWNSPWIAFETLAHPHLIELTSDDIGSTFRGLQQEALPADSEGLLIRLTALDIDENGVFELTLSGPSGRRLLRKLRQQPRARSQFSFTVPREILDGDGSYLVSLWRGDKMVVSSKFELRLEP